MDGFMVSLLNGRLCVANVAGVVYAIDPATGHALWRTDVGGPVWRPVATTPDAVLVVRDEKSVLALSPVDGSILWTYTPGGFLSPGLSVAGGVVYAGRSVGGVGHLDALSLRTGALLARINLVNDTVPMAPAVSSGRVLVAEWDSLLALTLSTSGSPASSSRVVDRGDTSGLPSSVSPVMERHR